MKQIDINSQDLEIVRQILEDHVPEFEVKIFGSRVQGNANVHSDLDLVVMTEIPLPTLKLADLKEAFSESDLPFRVDVVDWAATREEFRRIIEKQAVRFQ